MELGVKKGDSITVSGEDCASALSVIAAEKLGLKVAAGVTSPLQFIRLPPPLSSEGQP